MRALLARLQPVIVGRHLRLDVGLGCRVPLQVHVIITFQDEGRHLLYERMEYMMLRRVEQSDLYDHGTCQTMLSICQIASQRPSFC